MQLAAIIPAAGLSSRFGGPRSKLLEDLGGAPVIARSVRAFLQRRDVAQVVIATGMEAALRSVLPDDPRMVYCSGGQTRAHSVHSALRQVRADIDWVAVHDGARPLVSQELIERTFAAAAAHGAAVPALPVGLTIKEAAGPLPARVERTAPRSRLWAMQTPQVARRAELLAAMDNCPIPLAQVTDDVQCIELCGGEVWLVEGDPRNLKITTQMDLRLAALWLDAGQA